MTIESDLDRGIFVSPDDFSVTGIYVAAAGGSAEVAGIFDRPHMAAVGGATAASDHRPTFLVRSGDLPAGAAGGDAGDTLTIGGDEFRVADLEPDGTGMMLIILGRSS